MPLVLIYRFINVNAIQFNTIMVLILVVNSLFLLLLSAPEYTNVHTKYRNTNKKQARSNSNVYYIEKGLFKKRRRLNLP